MTVDHMLFNKLKWFNVADNADSVTANGKKYYALPSKITIKRGTSISTIPLEGGSRIIFELGEDLEVKCIGVNDTHYFFIGNGFGEVLKSNCKNIVW